MRLLPETTRTPLGFTVEGASPELLRQLLDDYDTEIRKRSRRIHAAMLPGLSEREIVDQFASVGLTAPREAIVWWSWHNGVVPDVPTGMKNPQLALEVAIKLYERADRGIEPHQWNPDWIGVSGSANDLLAMCCREESNNPRIRATSSHDVGTQDYEDPIRQVVSLCTPVTWWLLSLAKGWDRIDPATGLWSWDYEKYPVEWKMTGQM